MSSLPILHSKHYPMRCPNDSLASSARLLAAALLLVSTGSGLAAVRYVDVHSTNSTPPYLGWGTAATNIQDAVDAAVADDEILVTNGIYATGGRADNRVAVNKPLTLRSVNGPQFSTIDGGLSNRCVYLSNRASLLGFTVTNGFVIEGIGGGVFCESQSVVVSNCTLSGNSAHDGGGAYGGTLNNCIVHSNYAGNGANYDPYSTILNYSCTTPRPVASTPEPVPCDP
jgi:hypothetical protein